MNKLMEMYKKKCDTPSDIYQLLPYLKTFSDRCSVVVELGVRNCVSIYALLASHADRIYGYDIERTPEVNECEALAKEYDKDFIFIEADVLKVEIPECDFLFIDTFHSKLQLEKELKLHAHKARKYIGFHDVHTFWENAEPSYLSASINQVDCQEGLRYAIEPFMWEHPEWKENIRLDFNNGLLILSKEEIEYCIDCENGSQK